MREAAVPKKVGTYALGKIVLWVLEQVEGSAGNGKVGSFGRASH